MDGQAGSPSLRPRSRRGGGREREPPAVGRPAPSERARHHCRIRVVIRVASAAEAARPRTRSSRIPAQTARSVRPCHGPVTDQTRCAGGYCPGAAVRRSCSGRALPFRIRISIQLAPATRQKSLRPLTLEYEAGALAVTVRPSVVRNAQDPPCCSRRATVWRIVAQLYSAGSSMADPARRSPALTSVSAALCRIRPSPPSPADPPISEIRGTRTRKPRKQGPKLPGLVRNPNRGFVRRAGRRLT
jgi:hypothetical protein